MEYEALENFDSPICGAVSRGQILTVDPDTARAWCLAGLIREIKKKKETPVKSGEEVTDNGK